MIEDLKGFLDEKVEKYNHPFFIETDPIQIPHQFTKKEDIEIAAFLVSTIAWGNRKMIIKNGNRMMDLMGNNPYEFVMSSNVMQLDRLSIFVHRTFNSDDFNFFIHSLRNIYVNQQGLEHLFVPKQNERNMKMVIHRFKQIFFSIEHLARTQKHIADPMKGSAAKRINMLLRWMVRKDNQGVDFGLWKSISPSILSCPLDVHSGNVARKLGLLTRKANDWKAVEELDSNLRKFDSNDPVKYDLALFGLGVFEGF